MMKSKNRQSNSMDPYADLWNNDIRDTIRQARLLQARTVKSGLRNMLTLGSHREDSQKVETFPGKLAA